MKKSISLLLILLFVTISLSSCAMPEWMPEPVTSFITSVRQLFCLHKTIDYEVTEAATCTKEGKQIEVCTKCDKRFEEKVSAIPTIAHVYKETEKLDSTCTTKGYAKKTCACGDATYSTIDLKAHAFTEWVVITPNTCTENGVESHECKDCGFVETRVLKASHIKDEPKFENMQSLTCTTDCSYDTVIYCKVCKEEIERKTTVLDEAHHQADITIVTVTNPTCTSEGFTTYTCEVCDYYLIDNYVPKLEHEYVWVEALAPTCTLQGVRTGRCASCGMVQNEYVDVIEHTYDIDTVVAPTETATGYTIHSCVCGDSYVDTYVSTEGSEGLKFVDGAVSYGDCVETVVVVPLDMGGIAITAIDFKGFCNKEVTEIYLTTNIATIGEVAFAYSNLEVIHYEGTMEQWNAIEKSSDWDLGLDGYVVNCTDGKIEK